MTSVGEIWEALATGSDTAGQEEGWQYRRIHPDAVCSVLVALRQPSTVPALLMEIDAQAIEVVGEYPSARGFDVYPETVTPGPRGRTRLCLVLADAGYRDVFEVLANDVAEEISSAPGEGEAVRAFMARLHVWQNFMRKHGAQGLGQEAQIGLFGELYFLADHLLDRAPAFDAVDAWKGPSGGNQDFKLGERCVEIKSTTVVPPVSVNIASMTQLDETLVNLLLLCHVSLAAGGSGGESLPELIERLRATIEIEDASALDGFNAKLIEAGYLDTHTELYSDRQYTVRATRFFKVAGGFPRIASGDIREGISECAYTIVLAACAPFEVESTEATAMMLNEGSEIGT